MTPCEPTTRAKRRVCAALCVAWLSLAGVGMAQQSVWPYLENDAPRAPARVSLPTFSPPPFVPPTFAPPSFTLPSAPAPEFAAPAPPEAVIGGGLPALDTLPPYLVAQLVEDSGDTFRLVQQGSDPPPTPPGGNSGQSGETTYGKRPEAPPARRQFLRTQSPLLKQGDWQFDFGLAYTLFEYNFPTVDAGGNLVRADLRRRTLVAPLAFRYGFSERLQLYANLPVGWRNTEVATSPLTTPDPINEGNNYGGVGDLQLGGTFLLYRGSEGCPDVVGTLNFGVPTGEKSLLSNAFQGGLGTGFGSFGAQLMFIHTYDPVVIFWGGGYSIFFTGEIENNQVHLGDQILYQFGVGYAMNDRVTISAGCFGAYIQPTGINGSLIPNTQQEPFRFRTAVTTQRCKRIVEPFVEIGMTNTSPAVRTGVVWTY